MAFGASRGLSGSLLDRRIGVKHVLPPLGDPFPFCPLVIPANEFGVTGLAPGLAAV